MRKQMKVWLQLSVAVLLVLSLAACGGETNQSGGNNASESTGEQQTNSGNNSEAADNNEAEEVVPEGFVTYTDDTHDIYVYHPEDWTVKEVDETTFGFVSPKASEEDPFMENVGIQIIDLSGHSITLEEYGQLLIDQATSDVADFELLSSELVPGDGDYVDSYYIEYDGTQNGLPMAYDTTLMIDGDRGFILTYTAEQDNFDQYVDIANQIMDSFTFYN